MTELKQAWLSSIEEIIADARQGRMFILVDDEDRENEGKVSAGSSRMNASALLVSAATGA